MTGVQQTGGAGGGLSGFGLAMGIGGALTSAVGAYYAAKSAKYQARSAALSAEFQATMAYQNARAAEADAQGILRAGQQEAGRLSMAAGQDKAGALTGAAARGIAIGSGSVAEEQASIELARAVDVAQIGQNATRQAGAARIQGVNYRNEALLALTSARNLRLTAGSIKPWMAAGLSLITGAGNVGQQAAAYYGRR